MALEVELYRVVSELKSELQSINETIAALERLLDLRKEREHSALNRSNDDLQASVAEDRNSFGFRSKDVGLNA